MLIGEYEIDDIGKMRHVTCGQEYGTWLFYHNCWVTPHPNDPYSEGKYVTTVAPKMVQTLSEIIHSTRTRRVGEKHNGQS